MSPKEHRVSMWEKVVEAVAAGDDASDGLEIRHLERAENIQEHDDGSVTFEVERHPHVLGGPSRGVPSSFFERRATSYRWRPTKGLTVEASVTTGFELDEQQVRFDVERFLADSDVGDAMDECQTEEDAIRVAEQVDSHQVCWIQKDSLDDQVPDDLVSRYRDVCEDEAFELLMERWREGSGQGYPSGV